MHHACRWILKNKSIYNIQNVSVIIEIFIFFSLFLLRGSYFRIFICFYTDTSQRWWLVSFQNTYITVVSDNIIKNNFDTFIFYTLPYVARNFRNTITGQSRANIVPQCLSIIFWYYVHTTRFTIEVQFRHRVFRTLPLPDIREFGNRNRLAPILQGLRKCLHIFLLTECIFCGRPNYYEADREKKKKKIREEINYFSVPFSLNEYSPIKRLNVKNSKLLWNEFNYQTLFYA